MAMNKAQLVERMANKGEMTKKEAEAGLNAFMESVKDILAEGEAVSLVGFGTFEVRERAAREGRNPKTGETILIAASKSPAFKPGKGFKDALK